MSEYKAKLHAKLETLRVELAKGFLEKTVTIRGHKFVLHTLNEDEETWADTFIRMATPAALISSRKAPRLAASIKSFDDIPVESLFEFPESMPVETKKSLNDNEISKKFWYRDQMLYFLSEDANRPFIEELYSELSKLEKERDDALKALPNS
jgi:hypothetical protein